MMPRCTILLAFAALTLAPNFSQNAHADVILGVSDDGTDLTFKWSGTFDLTGVTGTPQATNQDIVFATGQLAYSLDGSNFTTATSGAAGAPSGNTPFIAANIINTPSIGAGTGFGFASANLLWDDSFGATPGIIAPNREWILAGETVASAFGTNLDSGPVVLWTHTASGQTISFGTVSAVPEPTSFAILGMCFGGALLRRKRNR